jgi:hypothetical protein
LKKLLIISTLLCLCIILSCGSEEPQGDWIRGDESEKLETIEKHFRGLDLAMMETGHRYQELYWAGVDGNWPYAKYQAEKIKLAIEYSLERRPARKKSAEPFLLNVLPELQKLIDARDSVAFRNNFHLLVTGCNNCHKAEKVVHFDIKIPSTRNSIIQP